ncbi:peroxide stress protein YaaA [Marinicauda algicola]|uniref:UPF0246 protein E5163_11385 n=1 Tax=Marinicauda algicola TaxID=2029849 RepID=A0A4S2GZ98_9PROT|nr:peroxide stress protein YaaA [Marinicauda algicola]TGY88413.1 peroxide stress protein YaaA [Marinicauda algicola]
MLVLLSPAKQLDFKEERPELFATRPALMSRTAELAQTTAKLSAGQLKALMDISDDLAELNRERFRAFDPHSEEGKPAALAFNGEVYRGLDAATLSKEDLVWAQDHVRILSGLYGALRPLDAIQPYRLEMGTRLKTGKGASLYDFWGTDIREELERVMDASGQRVVVNLASNEYARAARLKEIDARVIDVDFKEEKDGQLRALMVYAKKARGLMARWIIENRVTDPDRLEAFDLDGYRHDPQGSGRDKLLFTRPQPEKKR